MPAKEKEQLAYFFHLLNTEGFSWVAKGLKPVATFDSLDNIEYILNNPRGELAYKYEDIYWYFHPINARFRAGLRVWEKYSHLFSSKKIKIVSSTRPASSLLSTETVMMINVNETQKTICENYQLFSEILGYNFDVDKLVKRLVNNPEDHEKKLKGSYQLMGILYGFGKDNALSFQQKYPRTYLFPPFKKSYPRTEDYSEPNRWEPFLKDKAPFDPDHYWFQTPGFMVDPNNHETKELEEKYIRVFEEIRKEKGGKSELKWSLMQLM